MPDDKEKAKRKRVVVEEVVDTPASQAPVEQPLEEIKEKAQEIEQIAEEAMPAVSSSDAPVSDHNVEDHTPPQPMGKQGGMNPLVIIVPGIFLLGGLLGGILFYQNKVSGEPTPQFTDSPTIDATTTDAVPTATPEAEVDLEAYEVSVLNGSGTAGEAGKVESLIEAAGFTVSSTGNAPTYDFTKTVIQAKSDVDEGFIKKLSEALSESYVVDSKTASLSASSKNSVVVIVGSTKN